MKIMKTKKEKKKQKLDRKKDDNDFPFITRRKMTIMIAFIQRAKRKNMGKFPPQIFNALKLNAIIFCSPTNCTATVWKNVISKKKINKFFFSS
jgi:hypothetical protein